MVQIKSDRDYDARPNVTQHAWPRVCPDPALCCSVRSAAGGNTSAESEPCKYYVPRKQPDIGGHVRRPPRARYSCGMHMSTMQTVLAHCKSAALLPL